MILFLMCWCLWIFTVHNEVGVRLYFHRRLWFCSQGGVPGQVPPGTRYTPGPGTPPGRVHPPGPGTHLWAGTPPRTRYTPCRYTPCDQVPPVTRYPPQGPGTPRQVHPHPLPGRYTPQQVHPPGPDTPSGPGTSPRSSACWEIRATSGRYASYWNALLLRICHWSVSRKDVTNSHWRHGDTRCVVSKITRKHSRRMRTARFCSSGKIGYPRGIPYPQKEYKTIYTLPPQKGHEIGDQEGTWLQIYPIRPLWTDKHLWKHYLPTTSLAGGKNQVTTSFLVVPASSHVQPRQTETPNISQ